VVRSEKNNQIAFQESEKNNDIKTRLPDPYKGKSGQESGQPMGWLRALKFCRPVCAQNKIQL
jgi:hypothetical protein